METNIEYKQKYLKYKQKYLELKNLESEQNTIQRGGSVSTPSTPSTPYTPQAAVIKEGGEKLYPDIAIIEQDTSDFSKVDIFDNYEYVESSLIPFKNENESIDLSRDKKVLKLTSTNNLHYESKLDLIQVITNNKVYRIVHSTKWKYLIYYDIQTPTIFKVIARIKLLSSININADASIMTTTGISPLTTTGPLARISSKNINFKSNSEWKWELITELLAGTDIHRERELEGIAEAKETIKHLRRDEAAKRIQKFVQCKACGSKLKWDAYCTACNKQYPKLDLFNTYIQSQGKKAIQSTYMHEAKQKIQHLMKQASMEITDLNINRLDSESHYEHLNEKLSSHKYVYKRQETINGTVHIYYLVTNKESVEGWTKDEDKKDISQFIKDDKYHIVNSATGKHNEESYHVYVFHPNPP